MTRGRTTAARGAQPSASASPRRRGQGTPPLIPEGTTRKRQSAARGTQPPVPVTPRRRRQPTPPSQELPIPEDVAQEVRRDRQPPTRKSRPTTTGHRPREGQSPPMQEFSPAVSTRERQSRSAKSGRRQREEQPLPEDGIPEVTTRERQTAARGTHPAAADAARRRRQPTPSPERLLAPEPLTRERQTAARGTHPAAADAARRRRQPTPSPERLLAPEPSTRGRQSAAKGTQPTDADATHRRRQPTPPPEKLHVPDAATRGRQTAAQSRGRQPTAHKTHFPATEGDPDEESAFSDEDFVQSPMRGRRPVRWDVHPDAVAVRRRERTPDRSESPRSSENDVGDYYYDDVTPLRTGDNPWRNSTEMPRLDANPQLTNIVTRLVSAIDNLSTVRETSMMSANSTYMNRKSNKNLPPFSGDPLDWRRFKQTFDTSTESCAYTEQENITRLFETLKGDAKEATQPLFASGNSVRDIMATLELRFGNTDVILEKLAKKITDLPHIDSGKIDLVEFASKLKNAVATMKSFDDIGYLYSHQFKKEVLKKNT